MEILTESETATLMHLFITTFHGTFTFTPFQVFPTWSNKDSIGRLNCSRLTDKGLLKRVYITGKTIHKTPMMDGDRHYCYRLLSACGETIHDFRPRHCLNCRRVGFRIIDGGCPICYLCNDCCDCHSLDYNPEWPDEDPDDYLPTDRCSVCGQPMLDDIEVGQGHCITAPCWMYATGQRDLAAQ